MSRKGWMQRKTYKNLDAYLNSYGKYIVKQGRKIIKKKTKGTGKLSRSLKYKIDYKKQDFSLEFKSNKYGDLVERGVAGVGGLVSKGGMGKPTMRQGNRTYIDINGRRKRTTYKFKQKPSAKHFMAWVAMAGLSPKAGQTLKGVAHAVSWGVYRQGIPGISFFTQPISATKRLFSKKLGDSYAKDLEKGIIVHGFESKKKK